MTTLPTIHIIITCRDCSHWKEPVNFNPDEYTRDIKLKDGWVLGDCPKLLNEIGIDIAGDAAVINVKTDPNFFCPFAEPKA